LFVLDEFPYLAHETPGLPSMIQGLYDEFGPGGTNPVPLRLILCGSAISIMSDLLSGTKALRGRAALDIRVKPFGFRESREYWKIGNVESAFVHNALIGGTPGYRELVPDPAVPEQSDRIGDWVARNVLRSTVPLFSEANRVVHEDPRIRDTAVYGSLMATIAAGESSPSKIGGLLGRPASSLTYQLGMLESAGFIERRRNLLIDRRPAIAVADPVVRFHHLVIEPHMAELEDGRAEHVWTQAQRTVESKILGPHFEALATEWLTRYGRDEADVDVGEAGPATIACREHKTSHEVDILSIRSGERARATGAAISFIGEAKCRDRQPGAAELERLEHLRDLLESSGHDCREAALGLFSRTGFTDGLWSKAKTSHSRVLLVDLVDLYGGLRSSKP
jgi:hypothetical protein